MATARITSVDQLPPGYLDSLSASRRAAVLRALGVTASVATGSSGGSVATECPRATALAWRIIWPGFRLRSINEHEHHMARAARRKAERERVHAVLPPSRPPLPVLVTITRAGPRPLDDDNLAGSAKSVRDAVATWLGVDDAPSSPVTWRYAQCDGEFGVAVQIEHCRPATTPALLQDAARAMDVMVGGLQATGGWTAAMRSMIEPVRLRVFAPLQEGDNFGGKND